MGQPKKVTHKEPMLLVRWHDEGFPPIDLNKQVSAVVELVREFKKLREEVKILRQPLTAVSHRDGDPGLHSNHETGYPDQPY